MAFSLGEYQDIFLEEADEQLQELNQNLLELEKKPEDLEIINNIFRAAHSLKSSAAFVGLNELSDLAHKMENLLQGLRDRTLTVTPDIVDIIFKCFDEISSVIESVASGIEPRRDLSMIIREIQAVSESARSSEQRSTALTGKKSPGKSDEAVPKTTFDNDERKKIKQGIDDGDMCYEITVHIDKIAQMKWVKAQLIVNNLGRLGRLVKTIPSVADLNDDALNNTFKVIMLTSRLRSDIRNACNIDLITRVDVKTVELTTKDGKAYLKLSEPVTFLAGDMKSDTPLDAIVKENNSTEVKVWESSAKFKREVEVEDDDLEDDDREGLLQGRELVDQDRKKSSLLKTVKVSVEKLDQLLNNVAELVIANSGYYKLYEEMRKTNENKVITNEFKNRMEQMARIAKDLQSGIMKTRMVQIGQVFNRFKRLVRDLNREYNKEIELHIKGEETELDKKVIDAIGEPLLHLIRNAVDHGVETMEERKRIGKPPVAHITLNAYQGGNQIFVEVSDDGHGLNVDSIKRKALETGLTTPEILASMDNNDIYNFIFTPGFSTAKIITDISGRGVGMNVVKEIVTELNGNVQIETEPGMGTRFLMAFPLTLAIIPAIMVKIRHEMFAIPLSDVIETIKISSNDITTIEGHEVINLRGEILSLLRLNEFIGISSALTATQKIPVVVVGFGNRKIGLIVDILEGKQEIVIKSLEQNYKTVDGLAGASILGDGSICLILDISSMINKVISEQEKLTSYDKQRLIEKTRQAQTEKVVTRDIGVADALEHKKVSSVSLSEAMAASVQDKALPKMMPGTQPKTQSVPQRPSLSQSAAPRREEAMVSASVKTFDSPPPIRPAAPSFTEEKPIIEKTPSPPPFRPAAPSFIEEISIIEKTPSQPPLKPDALTDSEENIIIEEIPSQPSSGRSGTGSNEDQIRHRVHDALEDFKKELRENVNSAITIGGPNDHMIAALDITRKDLEEFQVIANMGAANAAESLSKMLGKRIDLSIPDVTIKPTEKIPEYLGKIDSIYIGIMMPLIGELKGTLLLILNEQVGFDLIDILYGMRGHESKHLDEDGESALKELLNIIGSSVVNVFADKTGLIFKLDIPAIVHDYMQSIIDSILVMHNMINDYTIIMDTAYYFADDNMIGNLLFLPETESLKLILERLRSNA